MSDYENPILRNLLIQTTRAYDEKLRALDEEKDRLEVTLDSIGDGVVTVDREGRVSYLNPAAVRLTGWSPERAEGMLLERVLLLVDDVSGEESPLGLDRCLEEGERLAATEGLAVVRPDGKRFAISHTVAPVRDSDGETRGAVLIFRDVTEKQLLNLQLAHQANHDALTGLLNRQAFESRLREAIRNARQHGTPAVLCYLDLDQFKLVNDTLGHVAGDHLLSQVADLLQEAADGATVVARLGGDEFGLLFRGLDLGEVRSRLDRIRQGVDRFQFNWHDRRTKVGSSYGIVPITAEVGGVAELLSSADHACYVAKERGRNRIQLYEPDDAVMVRRHGEMQWVLQIQESLDHDRFALWAQPIRRLDGGSSGLAFEVLIRMVDRDGTLVPPRDFIRAAERYGLMHRIDRWVVERVFDLLTGLSPEAAGKIETCSVNLSALSIGDEAFLDFVRSRLEASSLPPSLFCFEITETAALSNLSQGLRLIEELRSLGCRFALDDFGSGMSSYGHLKDMPVDFIKVDGGFVQDLLADPLDRAMVESVHRIANLMGIETVAESVATAEVAAELERIGVPWGQGYWLARPIPIRELLASEVELEEVR